ncbi:MAG: YdcF family protein [Rhodospirillales bacterium]|nr:YdcF family protein [Rhodospirillales bacterium]
MADYQFGKKKGRSSKGFFLLMILLFIVAVWFVGLIQFSKNLPETVEKPDLKTDAIVVLTGGSKRLDAGFLLLSKGVARRLFISGVYRGVEAKQLLRLFKYRPEQEACCIEIGHEADDTVGNARETAEWVKKHKINSIRLVTASYHMQRSLVEFNHAMPKTVIIAHPVFPDNVILKRWWMWPGSAKLIVSEYTKLMLAKALHWINDITPESLK